jgi:hypothetical protein
MEPMNHIFKIMMSRFGTATTVRVCIVYTYVNACIIAWAMVDQIDHLRHRRARSISFQSILLNIMIE